MSIDRLDALLRRFSVSATMFHSGPLCGINEFSPDGDSGQLHLVRRGQVELQHPGESAQFIGEPSLLFYPRPMAHRFITDAVYGADMVCANVRFMEGAGNPLARALPAFVCMPLTQLAGTAPVLDLLFDEAFAQRCGRQPLVDRLFEVVLIQILRSLMAKGNADTGLLAGLAHAQLARSLVAIHEQPAHDWTLQSLADRAGMSRSAFAGSFRNTLGCTPGDYLARWRVGLAQDGLRRGRPLKLIAHEVGYGSEAALSRAFKVHCGVSPREWRRGRD